MWLPFPWLPDWGTNWTQVLLWKTNPSSDKVSVLPNRTFPFNQSLINYIIKYLAYGARLNYVKLRNFGRMLIIQYLYNCHWNNTPKYFMSKFWVAEWVRFTCNYSGYFMLITGKTVFKKKGLSTRYIWSRPLLPCPALARLTCALSSLSPDLCL